MSIILFQKDISQAPESNEGISTTPCTQSWLLPHSLLTAYLFHCFCFSSHNRKV